MPRIERLSPAPLQGGPLVLRAQPGEAAPGRCAAGELPPPSWAGLGPRLAWGSGSGWLRLGFRLASAFGWIWAGFGLDFRWFLKLLKAFGFGFRRDFGLISVGFGFQLDSGLV